jgi:hypothetical protein
LEIAVAQQKQWLKIIELEVVSRSSRAIAVAKL